MNGLALLISAVGAIAVLYVHLTLHRLVRTHAGVAVTRLVLLGVGIGVGITLAMIGARADPPLAPSLGFALGFVAVHVPAAFVLLLKTWRHESAS